MIFITHLSPNQSCQMRVQGLLPERDGEGGGMERGMDEGRRAYAV
jgi:hypothetical protein